MKERDALFLLTEKAIFAPRVEVTGKASLYRTVSEYLCAEYQRSTRVEVYEELLKRDTLSSVSIGNRCAIPHLALEDNHHVRFPRIGWLQLRRGIDLGSPDGVPVHAAFCLIVHRMLLPPLLEIGIRIMRAPQFLPRFWAASSAAEMEEAVLSCSSAEANNPADEAGEQELALELELHVVNRHGLHARPWHAIVSIALSHNASVSLHHGSATVNAASVIELATLSADEGAIIVARATGPEASEVLLELNKLFESGFGEVY